MVRGVMDGYVRHGPGQERGSFKRMLCSAVSCDTASASWKRRNRVALGRLGSPN